MGQPGPRRWTRRLGALTLVGCGLLLAGCTDTTQLPEADQTIPTSDPENEEGSYDGPHTTSGRMSLETFPSLRELGPGWSYSTMSTAEGADYPGSMSPAVERDVADVVKESFPEGCALNNPMPLGHSALEVRYAFRGKPVTAFELEFASPAL
ncbi:MAG: hypothetical protein ACRDOY_03490, partial [Nocardioidaceae bacterium]